MKTLQLDITNGIGTITLNRPEALNALDTTMMLELREVTSRLEHDTSVRAVVLKAAGPHFMAGGDIKFFAETLRGETDPIKRTAIFEGFVGQLHVQGVLVHVRVDGAGGDAHLL